MIKNVAEVINKQMDLNKKNKDINKSEVQALDNATNGKSVV